MVQKPASLQDEAAPRRRGRPRAFEPETALAKVMDVFWQDGFAATSLDDLSAATGLNGASRVGDDPYALDPRARKNSPREADAHRRRRGDDDLRSGQGWTVEIGVEASIAKARSGVRVVALPDRLRHTSPTGGDARASATRGRLKQD